MDYQGSIWVVGDDPSSAIEATVTVDDGGNLSIVSKGDSLGSWPLDKVVVEPQGDSDFILTVGSDQIMFRPDTTQGYASFEGTAGGRSGLTSRIRSAASSADVPVVATPSERAPDSFQPPGKKKKEGSSKTGRNILILVALIVAVGYLSSRGGGSDVKETFTEIGGSLGGAATTTAPRPKFTQPITITGSGDDIVDVDIPGGEPALMQSSYSGTSNFSITSYGAGGDYLDLLVNSIGSYSGVRPLNFRTDGIAAQLDVTASGPWTIKLSPASTAPAMSGGRYSGSGDKVIRAASGSQATITHSGSSNFAVWAWGSSWDLLVNEIGNYSGTVRVPVGTVIFEVQADGTWTIDQG